MTTEDKERLADTFAASILDDVTALLRMLQTDIDDDSRASEDPEDDLAGIQITIACNDSFDDWTYQTGDNSYSGACYGYPCWGVGSLYRDDDPAKVAKALGFKLSVQPVA